MTNNTIHSVLLPFQESLFLLPLIALTEVLASFSYLPVKQEAAVMPEFLIGKILWRNMTIPLVTPNLQSFSSKKVKRCRVVIVNALFSSTQYSPYLAILFEQAPIRVTVEEGLQWQDELRKSITGLQQVAGDKEIILVDLLALSTQVEKCYHALISSDNT